MRKSGVGCGVKVASSAKVTWYSLASNVTALLYVQRHLQALQYYETTNSKFSAERALCS